MASSNTNEPLTSSELFGAAVADALQDQMLEGAESVSQTAVSSAQRVINDFDCLILPLGIEHSNETTADDTRVPSQPALEATATSVIDALDVFESRLSSVYNQENTSTVIDNSETITDGHTAPAPRTSIPTGHLQTQSSTTSGCSKQMQAGPHIMISYHHDSSLIICQRICNRLRERGYRVWMDTTNLHGSIHQGMAEAIENASIVLFCMNHQYYHSEFCIKEVIYTDKIHKPFIPCLLEPSYEPKGYLGIIIRDQLYINFSISDHFDVAFEELIAEIQAIEERSPISPIQHLNLSQETEPQRTELMNSWGTDISPSTQNQHDSLRAVVRDFRESINLSNQTAQPMTEEEFTQFVVYIRRRVFNDTLPLLQTEANHTQQILEEILTHSQNQTEFLRRITAMLSSITETRTIIKLSVAFAFVWSINKFLR